MRIFISILIVTAFFFIGCEKKKGCMDPKSLAFDSDAQVDNASCDYSKATFYMMYGAYLGVPIMKIDVSINGNAVGSITSIYPVGPGNCNAPGTVPYQFTDNKTVDWNTVVYLANGGVVFGSGQLSPSRYYECIKVNVTK